MNPAGPRRRGGKPATPRERVLQMDNPATDLKPSLNGVDHFRKLLGEKAVKIAQLFKGKV